MSAPHNRRAFMGQVGVATASLAAVSPVRARTVPRVVVGVIGPGGMGSHHLHNLVARKDVEVAYVCDVDQGRLATAAEVVTKATGHSPQAVKDLRTVLDDKRVDAVFIATPDHWHAPAAILALDAGKHVYVEKPCCHNIREGRLMADAVKRSGKCLQVGTQSRGTDVVREAMERIAKGEIGEVKIAKAWNSQLRRTIGRTKPSAPPPALDFDLWTGPAPTVPYRSNLLHGVWRWWYDFGCGDIGNDGVHDIDVAVWGLGVTTHPSAAMCIGGKYFFDDDMEHADTQYAVFEYGSADKPTQRKQLIFEQRIWSPYVQEGYENGAAFYGTRGHLVIGHTQGWKLYEGNQVKAQRSGSVDLVAHHSNFFDCIRGDATKLFADVNAGFLSATIVHLANIAARTGAALQFDPQREEITNHAEANKLVRRKYRADHWAVPKGVAAARTIAAEG